MRIRTICGARAMRAFERTHAGAVSTFSALPKSLFKEYLEDPSEAAWRKFKREYSSLLELRFKEDRSSFVKFAQLAIGQDVFIGCSCPTKTIPTFLTVIRTSRFDS